MQYGGGQRPFNNWLGVQICDKQVHAKRFYPSGVPWFAKKRRIWSMEDVFAILHRGYVLDIFYVLDMYVKYILNLAKLQNTNMVRVYHKEIEPKTIFL